MGLVFFFEAAVYGFFSKSGREILKQAYLKLALQNIRKYWSPTTFPHRSENQSAPSAWNSISNMLTASTRQLAMKSKLPSAQPHFTVNRSSLSVSIIYIT